MLAHELANLLLSMPDYPVIIGTDEAGYHYFEVLEGDLLQGPDVEVGSSKTEPGKIITILVDLQSQTQEK